MPYDRGGSDHDAGQQHCERELHRLHELPDAAKAGQAVVRVRDSARVAKARAGEIPPHDGEVLGVPGGRYRSPGGSCRAEREEPPAEAIAARRGLDERGAEDPDDQRQHHGAGEDREPEGDAAAYCPRGSRQGVGSEEAPDRDHEQRGRGDGE